MSHQPPKHILITSDNNELEYIRTIKNKTGDLYLFRFVKSIEKLGMETMFTEKELMKNMNNFFITIN